jgi:serine/threonine protein kinase/class 3 adenylate cyclase
MAELKTFLFTDIVRSVDLKREMPGHSDAERDQAFIEQILTPHRERIERELGALGGRVVSTAGDGHFLVFADTIAAARWAIGIQRLHREEPIRTPEGHDVAVRISMHLGIPQRDPHDPNNFVGKPVDYASRLSDYATGGQILVSRSVVAVLEDAGMDGVSFHHHGQRDLKGIGRVDVYELVYDRQGPRKMRPQPREGYSRQWTVLPGTMSLTEYQGRLGRASGARDAAGAGGAAAFGGRGEPATDVAPAMLGNYVLEERLGTGGMGDVYRARHSQFGRVRAVKVIRQHFVDAGHEEVIRRFYQEIKAVGALEHPNIVVAIDSSAPTDSVHYLVMEYIDGLGADELVAEHGPLPVAEACEIARQAARGLAYIHQHGMVHRDIKPSNLMLTLVPTEPLDAWHGQRPGGGRGRRADGPGAGQAQGAAHDQQAVVKILDLGLALLVGDDQQRLTLFDHRAMGTAMYMSPEQWKTTSVDIRADIYSLGCTLYHLLAGKPPFWESDLKPEKAHEREKLPPIRRSDALPPALWDVLERMTAKNPHDRFAEPAEVAAALAPWAEGHQLAELVRAAAPTSPRAPTQGFARSDTLVAKSAESDTRPGRTSARWALPASAPVESRQKMWRAVKAGVLLAAVAAIGWMALAAWDQHSRRARQVGLQVSANFAASAILGEINDRFAVLNELARDRDLRGWMLQLESTTDEEEQERLRNFVEQWLGTSRSNAASHLRGESWFVNERGGVQIARSPQSSKSTGRNYSHRDYFHGSGRHLPEGSPGLKPTEVPHLSAVYRSTSDGTLRVAFSVPIENGRSGAEREVIGVLAMSVDLGDFDVLERRLPEQYEVVLIDLREETILNERGEEVNGRGLVLHQRDPEQFGRREPPKWIGEELLARMDRVLNAEGSRRDEPSMLVDYRDAAVTAGRRYWGAVKAVIDPRPEREARATGWAVLVQEPL